MKIKNKIDKKIKPYKYGEQPKNIILKLNTNENPFPPSIKIIKNIIKEIKIFGNNLKFYPDPNFTKIKIKISKYYNVKKNEIIFSNSSDEILSNTFLIILKSKKKLLLNDITYTFYESYIKLYNIKYKIINLEKKFKINYKKYNNNKNNIIITNPNANTGIYLKKNKIEKLIIKNKNSKIIIDEAYIDFSDELSIIKLVNLYKNIIIIKTLSKSRSLANMRIGIAISNKINIKKLNSLKNSLNSYPINILSQISCLYSYEDNIYFEKTKKILIKNRKFLIENFKILRFNILKSNSNFILIKNKNINIKKLVKFFNKKNIFIRKIEIPKLENYIRISIDNFKNCKIIIKIIKNYLTLNKK